ncbi:MAG: DUF4145 domain-containing protein [Sulfurovum sp.]|nr:DUF4145 domain-containing protein [Sulfurovum sp.]
MDRQLYKRAFSKENLPEWSCPICQKGILQQVEGAFLCEETILSKEGRSHEDWEPEWVTYSYSNSLKCSNTNCGEIIFNIGDGSVDWDIVQGEDGYPEQVYMDYFRSKYFHPSLVMFNIPDNTPEDVEESLKESFALFFSNPDSSLNHTRIALEKLLNFLKVNKFTNRDGRRFPINLHRRIGSLPTKYSHIKDLCLAVKWLGNAGSHSGENITKDDVLDAYEIMDAILYELFDNKKDKATKLSKKINKKKGPK